MSEISTIGLDIAKAVTVLDRRNRLGSSTAAWKVSAAKKPTPDADISNWQIGSSCAMVLTLIDVKKPAVEMAAGV